ncbi:MAG: glycosyltransferase family 39 protein [Anaerolineales bacterium]|nr:glycosyltransferase family 39 protein [Anaerolineales bacterium]
MTMTIRSTPTFLRPRTVWLAAAFGILILWRQLLSERSLEAAGPGALIDGLFSLIFCAAAAALCLGLGFFMLRWFPPAELTCGERWVFAAAGGGGVAGTVLATVGMLAGATPGWVQAVLIALSIPAGFGWEDEWRDGGNPAVHLRKILRSLPSADAAVAGLAGLVLLTCLIRASAPPWDPDGLIYHLEAPRRFLEAGRVIPLAENAPANYPLLVEMLYMAGMAFGSDTAARIMHVGAFFMLLAGTGLFARRLFGVRVARIAVVILLGIPILPFWATLAHTDMAWAAFELLSIYAAYLFLNEGGRPAAIFWAGALAGFAMASKLLAVGTAVWLAIWILAGMRREPRNCFAALAVYGISAAAPLLPWLAKNWIGFENPFHPLAFGTFPAGAEQTVWMNYMQNGFGVGRAFSDYLLLPINLYLRHADFSTVGGTIELPSLVFPLAVLLPFVRPDAAGRNLAAFVLFRAAFWAAGAQQIRMLLPLFPVLSILAALVVRRIAERLREGFVYRVVSRSLLGGLAAATLIYQGLDLLQTQPWLPAFGAQSKSAWLAEQVGDFRAVRFIAESLPAEARVMMLWDGRGYYCDQRCVPDTLHAQWTVRVAGGGDPAAVAAGLRAEGFTHLLLSGSDAAFLLSHDPDGSQRAAWDYLIREFLPSCGRRVYTDGHAAVYEIACAGGEGSSGGGKPGSPRKG